MEELAYRLSLDFSGDSLEYTGRVEISARSLPSALTLDCWGPVITSATCAGARLEARPDASARRVEIRGIPAGPGPLVLEYRGKIDEPGLRGIYASPFGAGRLYSTYFEPVGARRLLPCIDRPDAKARFTLQVTAPSDRSVITNTPALSVEPADDGRRRWSFGPTPPMSTYLLYVGVGAFEERATSSGTPRVIVATPPGRSAAAEFSLDVGRRAVDYFTRYYGEPYPLEKLHLIAIPQFGTGAMENWGAITFQEYLLQQTERSPPSSRFRSLEVICHEVAHQWFGNLVTMRWWNDLWLNESFASFVATQASAALEPASDPWVEFLNARYGGALQLDALRHTHPIRVEVRDPDEIRQIFDEISYGKGASVLRMAEAYVGGEAFRQGVARYLAEHRWGNAEAGDLWRSVAQASEPHVQRLFETWVERPGFPVVSARWDGGRLALEQHRFTLLGDRPSETWPIPLQVKVGDRTISRLFDGPTLELTGVDEVPVVNPGRFGFYRVEYAPELRSQHLAAFDRLAPVDRWGLVDDAQALFTSGALPAAGFYQVLDALRAETDPLVLSQLVDMSRSGYPLVHQIPGWEAALRGLVVAHCDRLGRTPRAGESERERSLREGLSLARARMDPGYAAELAGEFGRVDQAPPEMVRPILFAYALRGGSGAHDDLLRRLRAATSAEAQRAPAGALGAIDDGPRLRQLLEQVFTGEMLIAPWMELLGSATVLNPSQSGTVWSFLNDRIDPLLKLTAGTSLQLGLMGFLVHALGLPRPDEMRAWAGARTFPESARAVQRSLDLLEVDRRLIDRCANG